MAWVIVAIPSVRNWLFLSLACATNAFNRNKWTSTQERVRNATARKIAKKPNVRTMPIAITAYTATEQKPAAEETALPEALWFVLYMIF
jgi:hypothetical protein